MGLAQCRNFMQCATPEAATQHRIDDGNAEGQGAGTLSEPGRPLQDQKAVAKLCDHS
jgi:hypothetical protein